MQQDASTAIRAENLSKTYRLSNGRRIEALKGVSIVVPKGNCVLVEGPSGSGKSTLLNLLGCLDRPSSGRIYFNDDDVTNFGEEELCRIRRQRIGFVFQGFHLLPSMTAWENASAGLLPLGLREEDRFRRASVLLDQLGLHDRMQHLPEEMSGGEQQRVCVARALINEPEILLADEPTSNIDAASAAMVLEALNNLRRRGSALLIATHSASRVRSLYSAATASATDVTYRLFDGRIEVEA